MGFSRNSTTPAKEVKDHLGQGVVNLKNAGVAAARGTRDAAAPKVSVMLTKVGLKKARTPKWPWVAGAVGAGVAVGGALAYLWYRQHNESIGESLLADEMLDDTEEAEKRDHPELTDAAINEELIESVTR